jgi:hypothetical protein
MHLGVKRANFCISLLKDAVMHFIVSRGRAVGIASAYGLDDGGVHIVQTGSGVYPTSYSMGTGGSFHEGNAAGT